MNQKKHEAADRKRIDHEKANEKLKEHTSNHINNIVEVKSMYQNCFQSYLYFSKTHFLFPIEVYVFKRHRFQ